MADDHEFHVDRTGILLFASALGETNPIYYDEKHAKATPLGGVIAPPTFAISSAHWNPDYGLRGVRKIPAPKPRPPRTEGEAGAGGGGGGGGNLARVLHGEQRFEYHQPIRPGMKLTVTSRPGKTWTKEGKRGGSLRFSETVTELRDEKGELVVTTTSIGVLTEKAVEQ
jgi:acyl dehydratase